MSPSWVSLLLLLTFGGVGDGGGVAWDGDVEPAGMVLAAFASSSVGGGGRGGRRQDALGRPGAKGTGIRDWGRLSWVRNATSSPVAVGGALRGGGRGDVCERPTANARCSEGQGECFVLDSAEPGHWSVALAEQREHCRDLGALRGVLNAWKAMTTSTRVTAEVHGGGRGGVGERLTANGTWSEARAECALDSAELGYSSVAPAEQCEHSRDLGSWVRDSTPTSWAGMVCVSGAALLAAWFCAFGLLHRRKGTRVPLRPRAPRRCGRVKQGRLGEEGGGTEGDRHGAAAAVEARGAPEVSAEPLHLQQARLAAEYAKIGYTVHFAPFCDQRRYTKADPDPTWERVDTEASEKRASLAKRKKPGRLARKPLDLAVRKVSEAEWQELCVECKRLGYVYLDRFAREDAEWQERCAGRERLLELCRAGGQFLRRSHALVFTSVLLLGGLLAWLVAREILLPLLSVQVCVVASAYYAACVATREVPVHAPRCSQRPKRGGRHWHASGRGAAHCWLAARPRGSAKVCRLAARRRGSANVGGEGGASEEPSAFACLFTRCLAFLRTLLLMPSQREVRAETFDGRLRELEDRVDALEEELRVEEKENTEMEEQLSAMARRAEQVRSALRSVRSGDMYWQSPEDVEREKEEAQLAFALAESAAAEGPAQGAEAGLGWHSLSGCSAPCHVIVFALCLWVTCRVFAHMAAGMLVAYVAALLCARRRGAVVHFEWCRGWTMLAAVTTTLVVTGSFCGALLGFIGLVCCPQWMLWWPKKGAAKEQRGGASASSSRGPAPSGASSSTGPAAEAQAPLPLASSAQVEKLIRDTKE